MDPLKNDYFEAEIERIRQETNRTLMINARKKRNIFFAFVVAICLFFSVVYLASIAQ